MKIPHLEVCLHVWKFCQQLNAFLLEQWMTRSASPLLAVIQWKCYLEMTKECDLL